MLNNRFGSATYVLNDCHVDMYASPETRMRSSPDSDRASDAQYFNTPHENFSTPLKISQPHSRKSQPPKIF